MERVSLGSRRVAGFFLGTSDAAEPRVADERVVVTATPVVAALAVGTTVSLFAATLKAPIWGTLLAGSAAALVTKLGIDRAGA